MSLPPGFLDELKSRASLAQVVGRKVVWDSKKSNQGKGDMWAPCPFHQEKTASFHVDDKKGFYYCFGCHAKGDMVNFVQETENASFIEAIEILARETGMQMPERDPKAQEKADRRSELVHVMERAVQYYRLQLRTAAGAGARDYLAGRGLDEAAQERWEIGFAPPGWQSLWDHLTTKNVSDDKILGAGLAKPSNQGKAPYDTFRNRIMFPIRDARGRAIAFGGRALDEADNAKYLNSPETELFDKGRSLFNQGPAREAAGQGKPLIVAEGYMDVIALSEAGFNSAVAPLGTAVTEDQLHLLWRIDGEPVVALDGDAAGLRAAMRLIDLALPLIEAGKSLRFCILPEGQDPDDLMRAEGSEAMQRLLDGALPLVQLLWRRETEGRVFDSPERKASLDKNLREAIRSIKDPSLRRHYGDEINLLRRQLFFSDEKNRGPKGGGSGQRHKGGETFSRRGYGREPQQPAPETRASALAAGGSAFEDHLREAVILATLVRHPSLIEAFAPDLEDLITRTPEHDKVRQALLDATPPFESNFSELCGVATLEKLFQPRHVQIAPGVREGATQEIAELSVAEAFAKIDAKRGAIHEISEAIEDVQGPVDEGLTWRLSQAADARNKAEQARIEDKADYEIGPNGARVKRDEKQRLDTILKNIDFAKGTRQRS